MNISLSSYLNRPPKDLWKDKDFVKEAVKYIYNSQYIVGVPIIGKPSADHSTLTYDSETNTFSWV